MRDKNKKLVVYVIIVIVLSIFIISNQMTFDNNINLNSDGFFHLQRFINLVKRLKDGVYQPFLDYNAIYNYGYPTPLFYPELFLYPFAIISCLGIDVIISFKIFLYFVFMLTALSMFLVLSKITIDMKNGYNFLSVVFSLLYAFNYFQFRHFSTGRYAELIAMIFIPVAIYGLYSILKYKHGKKYLIIGMSGLIYSHLLTAVFVSVTLFVILLINRKEITKKSIFEILKSIILTMLICAKQIFPVLEMMMQDDYLYKNSFLKTPTFNEMTYQILNDPNVYLSLIAIISFILFIFLSNRLKYEYKLIILGVFIFIINTNLFDWNFIEKHFSFITNVIQFPRRTFPPITSLILMGLFIILLNKLKLIIRLFISSIVVILLFINVAIFSFGPISNSYDFSYLYNKSNFDNGIYIGAYDYLSQSFDLQTITSDDDDFTVKISEIFAKNKTCYSLHNGIYYFQNGKKNTEIPVLFYKGYVLRDEFGQQIEFSKSNNGLIKLDDNTGLFTVRYNFTLVQIFSLLTSIVSFVVILFLYFKKSFKNYQHFSV